MEICWYFSLVQMHLFIFCYNQPGYVTINMYLHPLVFPLSPTIPFLDLWLQWIMEWAWEKTMHSLNLPGGGVVCLYMM